MSQSSRDSLEIERQWGNPVYLTFGRSRPVSHKTLGRESTGVCRATERYCKNRRQLSDFHCRLPSAVGSFVKLTKARQESPENDRAPTTPQQAMKVALTYDKATDSQHGAPSYGLA